MSEHRRVTVFHVFHHIRVSGGAEKHVQDLLCALDRDGGPVKPLLAVMDPSEGAELLDTGNVEIMPYHQAHPDAPIWLEGRFAYNLLKTVRKRGVDIIHTHAATEHRLALPTAVLTRTPLVRTQHSMVSPADCRTGFFRPVLKAMTRQWVAVSPDVAGTMRSVYRTDESRVAVIPNGIKTDTFVQPAETRGRIRRELGVPEKAFLLVAVSRLIASKNVPAIVRAVHRAQSVAGHVHVMVAGDGPERQPVDALASELGIQDRVHMLGTRSDVPCLLAAADAFITTSESEGCPIAATEALAAGLPVIATSVPGLRYVVTHEDTGLLVPFNDHVAAGQAIIRLMGDPEARARMSEAARERAVRNFSIATMTERYEALYLRLANRIPKDDLKQSEPVSEDTDI